MKARTKRFSLTALLAALAMCIVGFFASVNFLAPYVKDGDLTEHKPFPAGFLEGTAELSVGYTQGVGFTLNGQDMGTLYEGAFDPAPGNEYFALHVFTGSGAAAGVEIVSVTVGGVKQDLIWDNYAGANAQISADKVTVSGTGLHDATIVSSPVVYNDLTVTLKTVGDVSNLTNFSLQ